MSFKIELAPSAHGDLRYFRAYEQRLVIDGTKKYLREEANVESRKRKRLRPNELATWELKLGAIRVFYEIASVDVVRVLAIGLKRHNDLYIRGKQVEL